MTPLKAAVPPNYRPAYNCDGHEPALLPRQMRVSGRCWLADAADTARAAVGVGVAPWPRASGDPAVPG